MSIPKAKQDSLNSNGAAIFKKMLEDKRVIHAHLQKGGKLTDLKNDFNFATPLPVPGKR